MKVLNLRCGQDHAFEGWFGSEDDFQSQRGRGLVACPLCGDVEVAKLPTAPRLNLSHASPPDWPGGEAGKAATTQVRANGGRDSSAGSDGSAGDANSAAAALGGLPVALQAAWLKAVQRLVANTEDVGEKFPEEARRIHYGETPERGIRGQASAEERAALAEEGIDVFPLPVPPGLKGPLQ